MPLANIGGLLLHIHFSWSSPLAYDIPLESITVPRMGDVLTWLDQTQQEDLWSLVKTGFPLFT